MKNSFSTFWFNFRQKIRHKITPEEIALIRKTHLFDDIGEEELKVIYPGIRLVKFPKNKLIFQEGDLADALFIIVSGSVRVFTYDAEGKKLPLARLNVEDYFGEQAIIGQATITRNASIETIEDTLLIRIDARAIVPMWMSNHQLKLKLKEIGYSQAVDSLTSLTKLYSDIKPIFGKMDTKKQKIIELLDGEIIFNLGEKADSVYFILKGRVNIELPTKEINKQEITLHKGQLFGELGIINDEPRKGIAYAKGNVRLLVIDGEHFKELYHNNPMLHELLKIYIKTYQILSLGSVQQFLGNTPALGATLTSILNLDDGRSIITVRSLTEKIFTMNTSGSSECDLVKYKHARGPQDFVEIGICDHKLVAIDSFGEWDTLPGLCHILLKNETVEKQWLEEFSQSGTLKAPSLAMEKKVVCICMSVTRSRIHELISNGVTELYGIAKETGAGTICGFCQYRILEMLGKNIWITGTMELSTTHNNKMRSFYIKPFDQKVKTFSPGQYVVIQAKVRDNWVERSYTLSDLPNENGLRITVKKEDQGLFTTWLFDESTANKIEVNMTRPRGNFVLNPNINMPALCFAGGIGITPFITFAKALAKKNSKKRLHIVYCVYNDTDFIFQKEFEEIAKQMPSISLTYRSDNVHGPLTKEVIQDLIRPMQTFEVYICGSEGFEHFVRQTLESIQFPRNKIYSEAFLLTGRPEIA